MASSETLDELKQAISFKLSELEVLTRAAGDVVAYHYPILPFPSDLEIIFHNHYNYFSMAWYKALDRCFRGGGSTTKEIHNHRCYTMSHSPVLADSIELYSDCMANQSISTAREKNHESLGEPDLSAVKPAYFNNSMKK
ncbi:hypothetical protein M747DRAFT_363716 [Aspergillus niger ATCC 13496]|uniref:Contig An08c0320, genomic contig n=3 Tax=Aspergillus niger TaxID=5061 RepID=A2QSV1_ASPNC|nr:uncharacterized protein An08g12030 [Aspergillus niger]RDH14187.1 hypothetical protein M747DRAFT_363716 [Aspergillus niger ATCC 13496]CAK40079.1 unnamed protein product [Aspergillus niger]